jgi:branched-chain amino acid transport system substrate-binding protein
MNRRQFIQRATAAVGAASLGLPAIRASASVSGISDREILIGQSVVLSGPSASLGTELKLGIDACFKQVNDAGGINHRLLRLIAIDDGYEPDRCAVNTTKLISNERVFALLGYFGTATCNAALPVFSASRVPFIGALTGAESVRTPFNRYVFNVRASYRDEGAPIVDQLTAFGSKKVAIFQQADAFGDAARDSIERALKLRGLAPVAVATVARNSVDVRQASEVLAQSGATAVALASLYAPSVELVKALRAKGLQPQFAGISAIGTAGLLELGNAARGIGIAQVMPYPLSGTTAIAREYQQAMVAAGTPRFSYGSMEGFVGAKVLVEGLQRGAPGGIAPDREQLIATLETFSRLDLGGFTVNFSPSNHNGSKAVEMTVIGADQLLLH